MIEKLNILINKYKKSVDCKWGIAAPTIIDSVYTRDERENIYRLSEEIKKLGYVYDFSLLNKIDKHWQQWIFQCIYDGDVSKTFYENKTAPKSKWWLNFEILDKLMVKEYEEFVRNQHFLASLDDRLFKKIINDIKYSKGVFNIVVDCIDGDLYRIVFEKFDHRYNINYKLNATIELLEDSNIIIGSNQFSRFPMIANLQQKKIISKIVRYINLSQRTFL